MYNRVQMKSPATSSLLGYLKRSSLNHRVLRYLANLLLIPSRVSSFDPRQTSPTAFTRRTPTGDP